MQPERTHVALASRDSITLMIQWAETQIDAAHAAVFERPGHAPSVLHGHTWFVRAGRRIESNIEDVLAWHAEVERAANAFDHRRLDESEGLAEQLAAALGAALLADEIEVWRYVRGGRVGATWKRVADHAAAPQPDTVWTLTHYDDQKHGKKP